MFLKAGDMLALVTDSITEALNTENEYFGNERLVQYLSANAHRASSEITVGIRDLILDYMGPVDIRDDHTIVLIRRNGAAR